MDAGEQNFGLPGIHFQMNNGQGPGPGIVNVRMDGEPRDIWNAGRVVADDPHRNMLIGESSQMTVMPNIQRAKRQNCGNMQGQPNPFFANASQEGSCPNLMNFESEGSINQHASTCVGSHVTRSHLRRNPNVRHFSSGSLDGTRETYQNAILPGSEERFPHCPVGGRFITSNPQPHLGDIPCKRKSSMMDTGTSALSFRAPGERSHDNLRFTEASEAIRADNGSAVFSDSAPVILELRNPRGNDNLLQSARVNSVHYPQGNRSHIRNGFGTHEIHQTSVIPNNNRSTLASQTWMPRRNENIREAAGCMDITSAEPSVLNQTLGSGVGSVWGGHGHVTGQGNNNNNPIFSGAIPRDINSSDLLGSQIRHYTGGSSNWVGSECNLQNPIEQPNRTMSSLNRTLPIRDVSLNVPHVSSNPYIYPGSAPAWSSPYPPGGPQNRRSSGSLLPFPSSACATPANIIQRSQATYGDGHPSFPPPHGSVPHMYSGSAEGIRGLPHQNLYRVPFRGLPVIPTENVNRHLRFSPHDLVDQSQVYNGVDIHDQHSNMRLDVDNMSYEELLALEERIGNVNTGLSEDIISKCVNAINFASLNEASTVICLESEVKCSICQEEYTQGDEIGKLECSHCYHTACIKEWLMLKNLCPICKSSAYTSS